MRRRLSVMTVLAVIVSLCMAGSASAAIRYYGGAKSGASAKVRIKNKEPRRVESINWFFEKDSCGNGIFYTSKFKDLRVRDDRFKGVKKHAKIVGKFSDNARRIRVTITHSGEHPCEIEDVLKKTDYPTPPVPF